MSTEGQGPQQLVVAPTKSMGVAIILTILFGPLGMLYSTIVGGIVMLLIDIPVTILSFLTFGVGAIIFLIIAPVQVIWAAVAVNSHNRQIMGGQRQY